jgi:hypothetical protein
MVGAYAPASLGVIMAKTNYKDKQMRRAKYWDKDKADANETKPEKLSKERKLEIEHLIQSFMERYGMDKKEAERIVNANFGK